MYILPVHEIQRTVHFPSRPLHRGKAPARIGASPCLDIYWHSQQSCCLHHCEHLYPSHFSGLFVRQSLTNALGSAPPSPAASSPSSPSWREPSSPSPL